MDNRPPVEPIDIYNTFLVAIHVDIVKFGFTTEQE